MCVCVRGGGGGGSYGREDYKQFLWFAIRNSLSDNALDIYLAVMWVMFSFDRSSLNLSVRFLEIASSVSLLILENSSILKCVKALQSNKK